MTSTTFEYLSAAVDKYAHSRADHNAIWRFFGGGFRDEIKEMRAACQTAAAYLVKEGKQPGIAIADELIAAAKLDPKACGY
jgi:hypothetical protein